jgi:hypothetical protein
VQTANSTPIEKHGIKKTTFEECIIIDHTQVANRVHIATATARVLFDITYSKRAPLLQFNSLSPTSHKQYLKSPENI